MAYTGVLGTSGSGLGSFVLGGSHPTGKAISVVDIPTTLTLSPNLSTLSLVPNVFDLSLSDPATALSLSFDPTELELDG